MQLLSKVFNPVVFTVFILLMMTFSSCQKEDIEFNYDVVLNSPPMSDPRVHLLVLNEDTETNRFDLINPDYWTIDQLKIEQIKPSGEFTSSVQKSEVVNTGKGQMLVLITSSMFADEQGISKIKVNWPDKTFDTFSVQFAESDKSQRIIKIYMNRELIWPVPDVSRTYAIIEK